jgi:hypothetical protein
MRRLECRRSRKQTGTMNNGSAISRFLPWAIMTREVRCAREDRVPLVKFLIIQKEFRLVQAALAHVGGI